MKNTDKVTLTVGQLKRLIKESKPDYYGGLGAWTEEDVRLINPDFARRSLTKRQRDLWYIFDEAFQLNDGENLSRKDIRKIYNANLDLFNGLDQECLGYIRYAYVSDVGPGPAFEKPNKEIEIVFKSTVAKDVFEEWLNE